METNSKMGLFKHSVFLCSTNCLFYLYVYICLETCLNDFTFVFLNSSLEYLLHAFVFPTLEDDFNRIVDFLINFWVSFQISFLNFIMFAYVFGQFAMEAIKSIKGIHNLKLNCKYIYII